MARIRVVIISPFGLYRDALAALLRDQREIEVIVALAAVPDPSTNGAAPDAVLVDARLLKNRSVVTELRSNFAGAWIVAVSVSGTAREAVRCARAGIDGIVGQHAAAAEITSLLSQIRRGEFPAADPIAVAVFRYVANGRGDSPHSQLRLTHREREVAVRAARGLSNKKIAQELNLEIATIKNNMHNILRKTGLSRRSELAARLRGRAT